MKITDDYNAKIRLWARNRQVIPSPPPVRIPGFKSRRFSSHAEMNAWKEQVLRELARARAAQ
ncbi:MAG: hypothetical protein N3I86_13490 [Verrucomicrobiae bacterium]|nr:hypothetical protein [Verrucomicrobiae bacterium]MDW8308532.1 hypothetical protein [Verrucomicrobiales bacterium]